MQHLAHCAALQLAAQIQRCRLHIFSAVLHRAKLTAWCIEDVWCQTYMAVAGAQMKLVIAALSKTPLE
jgi:hypothetical protein